MQRARRQRLRKLGGLELQNSLDEKEGGKRKKKLSYFWKEIKGIRKKRRSSRGGGRWRRVMSREGVRRNFMIEAMRKREEQRAFRTH